MPYADPEKQREADRKRKTRARAEKKAAGVRDGNPDVRARAWTFIVYPESAPENGSRGFTSSSLVFRWLGVGGAVAGAVALFIFGFPLPLKL